MTEAEKKAEAPAANGDGAAKAKKDKGPVGITTGTSKPTRARRPRLRP